MAFGFVKPAKPSPGAEAVGMALMQRRLNPQPAQAMPAATPTPGQAAAGAYQMRMAGARMTGGPAQIDHGANPDGTSPNAVSIAVGEALTRVGGGNMVNPDPNKPRAAALRQLQHLGLSATEAQLLVGTGGA